MENREELLKMTRVGTREISVVYNVFVSNTPLLRLHYTRCKKKWRCENEYWYIFSVEIMYA